MLTEETLKNRKTFYLNKTIKFCLRKKKSQETAVMTQSIFSKKTW